MAHWKHAAMLSASTARLAAARSSSSLCFLASPPPMPKLPPPKQPSARPLSSAKKAYGAWVSDSDLPPPPSDDGGGGGGGGIDSKGGGAGGMTVFGRYAGEYDASRPDYPPALWDRVLDLVVPGRGATADGLPLPDEDLRGVKAVDVAAGTGRGALALARRGLSVTALDLDAGMLDTLKGEAASRGLDDRLVECRHGPAEETGLVTGGYDLVTAMQAFHWFDAGRAVGEFHRILRPRPGGRTGEGGGGGGGAGGGERQHPDPLLVLAWNDRDLSVGWMQEYESLIERYNPKYDRSLKQAEAVMGNSQVLDAMAGTFEPAACGGEDEDDGNGGGGGGQRLPQPQLIIPNPTPNCTLDSVLALTRTFSYVRNALTETELADLERDVAALVTDMHGDDGGSFDYPWVTKAYLLRPK